jgi:hypothetical protein
MGSSLKVDRKSISHSTSPERDAQFKYIAKMREEFTANGCPLNSVDTKKKEMVGQFKNAGTSWERSATKVNDHDFPSQSDGKAIPYGIYEPTLNRGSVFVGTSCDTSEFATESIAKWWAQYSKDYQAPERLLIIADGGGSNASRSHAWKAYLQTHIADKFGIPVTVCHFPPGTSKWNPIEHRLFSEISKNWKGRPLDSYDAIINYIQTTTTKTGLQVTATLVEKEYQLGIKIPDEEFRNLSIEYNDKLPKFNYTIKPRENVI